MRPITVRLPGCIRCPVRVRLAWFGRSVPARIDPVSMRTCPADVIACVDRLGMFIGHSGVPERGQCNRLPVAPGVQPLMVFLRDCLE